MSNASIGVVKSGWLHRRSSILHVWKRQWVTLGADGLLRYFDGPQSSQAEDAARMRVDCIRIRSANDITDVSSPPVGCGRSSLFSLEFKNKTWIFCAESPDDMEAWRLALEDSRVLNQVQARPPAYNPGTAPPPYPGTQPPPQPQQPLYQPGPYQTTTTTTVYQQRPYPTQGPAVAYPGQVYYGSNPPQQIVNPVQPVHHTTVVVQQRRPHPRRCHRRTLVRGVVYYN